MEEAACKFKIKGFACDVRGNSRSVSTSEARGYTMPVFTFEKISPPVRRSPATPAVKKPRSVIGQIIDRLVETRARRNPREEHSVRRDRKSTG